MDKAPTKTDYGTCLPGSCHVSRLLNEEATEQAGLSVDIQDASSCELPRAGDSRILA